MTWPKVFGAHAYDVQWRDITGDKAAAWQGADRGTWPATFFNRWDQSWQFTNQPRDGHTYEVRVWAYDEDTPTVFPRILGFAPSARTAHVTGLTPGHHCKVLVCAWNAPVRANPRSPTP